jgi:Pyruvate/2-oxoacid:ferredoxin oxidoreductase delta subunit
MCLTCGEHNAEKLWYLDKEKHRIRSLGVFRDLVSRKLNPLISVGLNLVRAKQPDYTARKMPFVSRELLSWFAKTLHGMQFLPDRESAFKTIDMANELALMPCLCHQVMDRHKGEAPLYRCIAMNIAADIWMKDTANTDVKPLNKQEAKDLVAGWRARGAWQSVGWLWDANVIWVCNCDWRCATYRAPEAKWGGIPSFVVASASNRGACVGCRECAKWCQHEAIAFAGDDKVVVDQAKCRGCGLCVEHCTTRAIGFEPRQVYYDVRTKSVRRLSDEKVNVR